jgi:hypothetical protein
MYVTHISVDRWVGPTDHGSELECSSVKDIVPAIRALNGHDRTNVILHCYGRKSLTIGGGNDGRYIVFVSVDTDREFYNLINPEALSQEELAVVAGGQTGLFPARQCLDLQAVLKAAKYFAKHGRMEPSLVWEKQ